MMRSKLAVGNKYCFPGCPGNGFVVNSMSLPGTPSDDGGLPVVHVLDDPGVNYRCPVWRCKS